MKPAKAIIQNVDAGDGRGENHKFAALAAKMVVLAGHEGLAITPFFDSSLPHFSALSAEDREHVLWQLGTLVSLCETLHAQNIEIRSVRRLTTAFLNHMKYVVPNDFMEHVEETDFIDAYGLNNKMIYANLRFFEVCSYSLEDLYCRSWMELFKRNRQEIVMQLFDTCAAIFQGKIQGVIDMDFVPTHTVSESYSPRRVRIVTRPKVFSPIYQGDQVAGVICLHRSAILL